MYVQFICVVYVFEREVRICKFKLSYKPVCVNIGFGSNVCAAT